MGGSRSARPRGRLAALRHDGAFVQLGVGVLLQIRLQQRLQRKVTGHDMLGLPSDLRSAKFMDGCPCLQAAAAHRSLIAPTLFHSGS